MLKDLSLEAFLGELSGRTPAPGGGAASALAAGSGVALSLMSAAYTTGNEKFKAVEPRVQELIARLQPLQRRLLELVDEDAGAYAGWVAARGMPRGTAEERARRAERLRVAQESSTAVPEEILSCARQGLALNAELAGICNPNLISDVAVAARLLEAGARGAAVQVLGNLKAEPAGAEVERRRGRVRQQLAEGLALAVEAEKKALAVLGLADDT